MKKKVHFVPYLALAISLAGGWPQSAVAKPSNTSIADSKDNAKHLNAVKPTVNLDRNKITEWGSSNLSVMVDVPIKGRVTDEKGEGLPGVSVQIKGTTNGTTTNSDGSYTLTVPTGNATLVFSFIGYKVQEVPVNNRTTLNVSMASDTKALEEVVVVGYGTVKKSDVTGSLSSVSAEKIQEVPVANVSQALQGRAAGVDVSQNNSRPGEAPVIRIRGNRSLKATNNPLYVVDGIPLAEGSGINDFNPADVASVEVLKDASATAIYGSRGANGVILVTTKKGKSGKAKVNYDGYVGLSKPLAPLDMMDGGEWIELRREARRNSNGKTYRYPYADPNEDFSSTGGNLSTDLNMWESVAAGYEWLDKDNRIPKTRPVTDEERAAFQKYYEQDLIRYRGNAAALARLINPNSITEIPIYDPSKVRTTDWADMVLQTGVRQNHQVSVSGGSDLISVILSLGYFNEKPTIKAMGYERYNVRLGIEYKISEAIKVGGSGTASLADQDYGTDLYGRAVGQLPIAVPRNAEGNLIPLPGNDALIYNPLYNITNATENRRTNRFFGSYYAEVNIAKGLKYRANFGPDFRQYRRGVYYGSLTSERTGAASQANYDQEQRFAYVLENLLFYNKQINEQHSISVTALQSIQKDRFESSAIQVNNLPYDSQQFYKLGSTNNTGPESFDTDYNERKLFSWMGRVNYSFRDKYLLTVSGRYDGASVLAPGQKWDFFPSFALAWKMKEESFLSNIAVLDDLKLRVGYGKTGNSAVSPYTTQGALAKTRYTYGDAAAWGFRPDQIANPNLKWESTAMVNAGVDFAFLGNRLTGTVDVYESNTTDLIMDRQVPTASGFGFVQENIGAVRNRGLEVSLSSVNLNTPGGLRWTTDVIYGRNKEEITELYGGERDDIGNRWFIGQPTVVYYDVNPIGVWQSEEVDEAARYGKIPGQGKFQDLDNNGVINQQDRVILGTNVPKWSGSIANAINYKGIDLSFLFYARIGQSVRSSWYRPTLTGRYPDRDVEYWTPTNPSNVYPRPNMDQERPENPDSYLVTKASFVKLRTVTLGYNFPQNITSRLKMESLNIYVSAFNPLLFTKYKGMDPEFSYTPVVSSTARTQSQILGDQIVGTNFSDKSLQFGVRIGF